MLKGVDELGGYSVLAKWKKIFNHGFDRFIPGKTDDQTESGRDVGHGLPPDLSLEFFAFLAEPAQGFRGGHFLSYHADIIILVILFARQKRKSSRGFGRIFVSLIPGKILGSCIIGAGISPGPVAVAISAVNRSPFARLKWQLGNGIAALRALPFSLNHFSGKGLFTFVVAVH
jgi:hypothetical protein